MSLHPKNIYIYFFCLDIPVGMLPDIFFKNYSELFQPNNYVCNSTLRKTFYDRSYIGTTSQI